jgi:glycosyltransferase involved in cell wall biosynthesis
MSIAVVITALNHAGTLIESTESVLSQTRLPDQFGLSLGPSIDGTERMAEFYEEEYDFVHFDRKPDTARKGLTHLRLGVLEELQTDYVLFVRGNTYLKRDTLESVETAGDSTLVTGGVDYLDRDGNSWSRTAPVNESTSLLKHGPVEPGSVIWPRRALIDNFTRFQVTEFGPFTALGWLILLGHQDWQIDSHETTFVETWDDREGESVWTAATVESMIRLLELINEVDSSAAATGQFQATVQRILQRDSYPVEYDEKASAKSPFQWADMDCPLPE